MAIKVQFPFTSYSPSPSMRNVSPAAKSFSPRAHLKCPLPARKVSVSALSANSLKRRGETDVQHIFPFAELCALHGLV